MSFRPRLKLASFLTVPAIAAMMGLASFSIGQDSVPPPVPDGSATKATQDGSAAKGSDNKGSGSAKKDTAPDIVATAAAAGQFKTLIAAAKAAGVVGLLQSPGPLTVFAPSDEAFKKLPAGTVEDLLKPENKEKLKSILAYHVVGGKVMAGDIKNLVNVQSHQGSNLNFAQDGGSVIVHNAKVVKADIACSNGVIHIIDTVMLPGTEPMKVKKDGSSMKDGSAKKDGSAMKDGSAKKDGSMAKEGSSKKEGSEKK